ncbi:hypothetical protein PUMCH_000394 [Australozyma saopauloensis]|uniref:SANT domain-containing protein n=1 Tax=Australozyma saopauloensis TaxID=291208 RepID=A0AAX4H3Z9_9ASCO|nr:hypothetical protein PUMCH_000394 [[Candida] saopauloensis]
MSSSDIEGHDANPDAKDSLPRSNRSQELDEEYCEFFSDSVTEFFSLSYLQTSRPKKRTPARFVPQPSKITLNSSYYCPLSSAVGESVSLLDDEHSMTEITTQNPVQNDFSFDNKDTIHLPGTFWTSQEKDTFFNCLARFTIHRSEEFLPHLPSKSQADILAYYNLLANELRHLKNFGYIEDDVETGRVAVKTYPSSVPYSEVPIAHEVDEEYIEYEEDQSILLGTKDHVAATKRASKRKNFFSQYVKDAESRNALLIDEENANGLAKIYRANQITPTVAGRKSCRFSLASYFLIEQLVKLRTRQILENIIYNKTTVFDGQNEDTGLLHGAKILVNTGDVYKSIVDTLIFETSVGSKSRYRDGKYPFLDQYWRKVVQSLDIDLESHEPGPQMSRKKFLAFEQYSEPVLGDKHFMHPVDAKSSDSDDWNEMMIYGARGVLEANADSEGSSDVEIEVSGNEAPEVVGSNNNVSRRDTFQSHTDHDHGSIASLANNESEKSAPVIKNEPEEALFVTETERQNHCNGCNDTESVVVATVGEDELAASSMLDSADNDDESFCAENESMILRNTSVSNCTDVQSFIPLKDGLDPPLSIPNGQMSRFMSPEELVQKPTRVPTKRILQDYLLEDALLKDEEKELEALDKCRDYKYMRTMRKRLRLNADESIEELEFCRANKESTIIENLNKLWDRSYTFY